MGGVEEGCCRQARRALRTRRSANQILIVDEVLAVGDAEFQKKCLGKMKDVADHDRSILFVSHNMAAMCELCDKTQTENLNEVEIVFK